MSQCLTTPPASLTNWKVSEEVSHSDQRVITFSINEIKQTEATLRRNVRKVNWTAVSSDLRGAVPRDTPSTWTRASLDAACESITCTLQKSLDKHAPKKPPAAKFNYWWNDECTEKKSLLKTAELLEQRHLTSTTKLDLKTKRNNYKNAIYMAKKTYWKKFIRVFWINRIAPNFLHLFFYDWNGFWTRRVGLEVYCKLKIHGNGNGNISCAPLLPVNLGSCRG
jgi:hypothetical protein